MTGPWRSWSSRLETEGRRGRGDRRATARGSARLTPARGKLPSVLGGKRARGRAGCAVVSLLLVAACARLPGSTREPSRSEVDAERTASAVGQVPADCRSEVAAALEAGEQREGSCSAQRDRAARQALASGPRRSFGMIDRQTVRLSGVALVLSQAHHCRRWPLRAAGQATLDVGAARAAGCAVRRYEGPLAVGVVSADGELVPVSTVRTDMDGKVEVVFAEIDALLRARGRDGLFSFAALALGAGAWAGRLDLGEVRGQLAGWHATWVERGRGSPGLFIALHPNDEAASAARVRALEATLRRHADDMAAVERGELTARRFLERHVWSPYRSRVERLADGSSP